MASAIPFVHAQGTTRRAPLGDAEIDTIAHLLKLEDTRQFDEAALGRAIVSPHPEVRRRAVVTTGRIVDPRGRALLAAARAETDPEILATIAFSTGQLKDAAAIPWLAGLLAAPATPPAAAFEAARALGKIRVPEARAALATYLTGAPATAAAAPLVAEALLSIGRFAPPADIAPIVKWIESPNVEVRWRATWALFRPRDPAGVPHLLRLASDRSPEVRFWAVRGLPPGLVDAAGLDQKIVSARLRDAVKDPDRRVRTEALRVLTQYDDDASFAVVLAALDSPDTWLSVSAAESLGRFVTRKDVVVPKLVAASAASRPAAMRIAALAPLAALAPEAATTLAQSLSDHAGTVAKTTATQTLARLGGPRQGSPAPPRPPRQPPVARADAEYRDIVKRWIVADYAGKARPRVTLETPRGAIEIELHAGDAPLGLEHLVRVVGSGEIVGTEFGRVVPNFVAQQRAIRDDVVLRDEVNRRGLLRGTLSWASAGLDTGRPGYTLANTPQPHNEGDFTSLGHVVRGMDAVDRLELGDKITGARIRR
jgi:HEAT repeat protein